MRAVDGKQEIYLELPYRSPDIIGRLYNGDQKKLKQSDEILA